MSASPLTPAAFIDHWSKAEANERANSQSFLLGLTQLLGVPQPSHNHADRYSFEYPVKVPGGTSTNFLDLYRRAHFVLESKQFTAQKLEQSALEAAAIAAGHPVTAADLAPYFTRAKTADLQEILESLVTLGRARQDGEKFGA